MKGIANILKSLMPKLVHEIQSGFIPRRKTSDNILVAREVIHSMKQKKSKKGWLAAKLDLEKIL